jgi:hypothetical protein
MYDKDLVGEILAQILTSTERIQIRKSNLIIKNEAFMKFSYRIVPVIFLFLLPALVYAQNEVKVPVNLKGVWERVSLKVNGKPEAFAGRQIKLLTARHYSWVKQDKKAVEELLAKGTLRDSLAAYHDEFGAGTYRVDGDNYIETTEFFGEPQYIGTSLKFKFKLEKGLWYITGHYTHLVNGKKINEELIEETWKLIE